MRTLQDVLRLAEAGENFKCEGQLEEAVAAVHWLTEFAYVNGCHELGYDPLKILVERLDELTKQQSYQGT